MLNITLLKKGSANTCQRSDVWPDSYSMTSVWADIEQARIALCSHCTCQAVEPPECACADMPWALKRMEAVLQPIMWRNDKISVGDELKLPPRMLDVSAAILPHAEIYPQACC